MTKVDKTFFTKVLYAYFLLQPQLNFIKFEITNIRFALDMKTATSNVKTTNL